MPSGKFFSVMKSLWKIRKKDPAGGCFLELKTDKMKRHPKVYKEHVFMVGIALRLNMLNIGDIGFQEILFLYDPAE